MCMYIYIYIQIQNNNLCIYIHIYTICISICSKQCFDIHPKATLLRPPSNEGIWSLSLHTVLLSTHETGTRLGFFPVSETVSCHQSSRKNTGADMIDKWLIIKLKSSKVMILLHEPTGTLMLGALVVQLLEVFQISYPHQGAMEKTHWTPYDH